MCTFSLEPTGWTSRFGTSTSGPIDFPLHSTHWFLDFSSTKPVISWNWMKGIHSWGINRYYIAVEPCKFGQLSMCSPIFPHQFIDLHPLFIQFSSGFALSNPGVSGPIRPPTPGRMARPSGRPRPAWHRHRGWHRCRQSKAGAAMDGTGGCFGWFLTQKMGPKSCGLIWLGHLIAFSLTELTQMIQMAMERDRERFWGIQHWGNMLICFIVLGILKSNGFPWGFSWRFSEHLHDRTVNTDEEMTTFVHGMAIRYGRRMYTWVWITRTHTYIERTHMAVCQNLVPLVNIKIAGKWMFIPLNMVLIGIDPYPYWLKYWPTQFQLDVWNPGISQQRIDFPNVPGRPRHGALPGVHMDPKLQELQAGLPPGWEATCQAEALPGLPQWGAVGMATRGEEKVKRPPASCDFLVNLSWISFQVLGHLLKVLWVFFPNHLPWN